MDASSATKMHFQSDMVCTVKLTQSTQSPRGTRFSRWEIRFSFGLIYWPFSEDLNHVVSWHIRHGKILIKKMKIVIQLVAIMEMDNSGHILAKRYSSSHQGLVSIRFVRMFCKLQEVYSGRMHIRVGTKQTTRKCQYLNTNGISWWRSEKLWHCVESDSLN